jgi:subtilisin family serine protease
MRKIKWSRVMGSVLLMAAVVFVQAQPAQVVASRSVDAPSQSWRSSRSASWVSDDAQQFSTDHILIKRSGHQVERVDVGEASVSDAVAFWQQQDDIEYAEPDGLYRVLAQEESWGFTEVQAGAAATTNGATGGGIVVAVVDTGVDYEHEDLDANNWVNTAETAGNNVDDDGNGYVDDYYGYDFIGSLYTAVTPDSDPQDEHSHGTHVSGIIAAENNSVGVRGVASSAQIMPVKVLDSSGYGFDSTIADGIRYAVDKGADVINLSLGSSMGSNTLKSAIDYAESNGVLVVAASGNSSQFSAPSYPAGYSSVVSVGAYDDEGYKAEWSNWGKVDVMAPGVDIESSIPGNLYASYSGTSMASPHVAGVAALVMQKFGTSNPRLVRHIIEATADDFGVFSGPDYVSGNGAVNALDATGTQTTKAFIYADSGFIVSDGASDTVVTVSLRTAGNVAVAGETVSWSTTRGTLSAATSTTDANGLATVILTADDTTGLATVTADPANYDAASWQIAILDDIVYAESVGVSLYTVTTDDTGDLDELIEIAGGSNSLATAGSLSANMFAAGDEITIWGYPTAYDRETHDVSISYAVNDPDGVAIDDMSGTLPDTAVGEAFWYWYFPQNSAQTNPIKIPKTASAGEYTATITITDNDSGESSSSSANFWVSEQPEILVVDDDGYCFDTPVEGLDFGYIPYCVSAGKIIADALGDAGYETMVWNTTNHGYPTAADLALFPLVVVVNATFASGDTIALQEYMDNGGHVLITSEALAYYNWTGTPTDFLWNYLHVNYASSVSQPALVAGVAGSDFAGDVYNVDTYNLEGNGAHNMYQGDELLLDPNSDEVEAIFAYSRGDTDDKVAGVKVQNSTYKAAFLSFGVEAINDVGTATKAQLLTELTDWLLNDRPTITKVTPGNLANNKDRTITITGTGFQATGETKVKLRNRLLSNVQVQSRTTITATVPAGMNPRQYSLTVVRPDGRKVTEAKAVTITKGNPVITSVTPGYASNDQDRTLTISGNKFSTAATVWLGQTRLTDVEFGGATMLTVTVPEGFTSGKYTLKVKNPSGKKATKVSAVTVRLGFTEELGLDDVNDQVLALEKRLSKYGYFTAESDTTFDNTTEEALVRYQSDQVISTSGVTDAMTRYRLNTLE